MRICLACAVLALLGCDAKPPAASAPPAALESSDRRCGGLIPPQLLRPTPAPEQLKLGGMFRFGDDTSAREFTSTWLGDLNNDGSPDVLGTRKSNERSVRTLLVACGDGEFAPAWVGTAESMEIADAPTTKGTWRSFTVDGTTWNFSDGKYASATN